MRGYQIKMKTALSKDWKTSVRSAFTLPEVMMAVLVTSLLFVGFYLGITQGFAILQVARENLRATQILQEESEVLRLYTFDQITNHYMPASQTWTYYPGYQEAASNKGITYTGTIDVNPLVDWTESYAQNLRKVTFTLTWVSGNVTRTRQLETLVSQYGLQSYVYY